MSDLLNANSKECCVCEAKPGSPTLCETCLYNRDLVAALQKRLRRELAKLRIIGGILNDL